MRVDTVRAVLSIVVVGTFVLVLASLAVFPLLLGIQSSAAVETIKDFSAALSGTVGLIIGYFFGMQDTGHTGPQANDDENTRG